MTLTEAFELYDTDKLYGDGMKDKTRRNYRSSLASFTEAWGDLPIQLITYDHIVLWKKEKARIGIQNSSMGSNLSHLRQIFKYLERRGINVMNHRDIERPPARYKEPVWLDTDEIKAFISAITNIRDKAIFACLFSTGARISELLSLDRDSIIDGQAKILGKGDREGILNFDGNCLKILNEYLDSRKDQLKPMFVSGQYRRITVARVEQLAHIYRDKADLGKNFTPHVARHSFASNLKLNGADIYDIGKQLRHSNISSTMIYTHIDDKKRDADYHNFHTPIPL